MKNKYSKNPKLNAVLTNIDEQLRTMCNTEDESLWQIASYITSFPRETDYNIAQYGNLLIYYSDIYNFYREAGYKTTDSFSPEKIWNTYCRQVGYVARLLMKETNTPLIKWRN